MKKIIYVSLAVLTSVGSAYGADAEKPAPNLQDAVLVAMSDGSEAGNSDLGISQRALLAMHKVNAEVDLKRWEAANRTSLDQACKVEVISALVAGTVKPEGIGHFVSLIELGSTYTPAQKELIKRALARGEITDRDSMNGFVQSISLVNSAMRRVNAPLKPSFASGAGSALTAAVGETMLATPSAGPGSGLPESDGLIGVASARSTEAKWPSVPPVPVQRPGGPSAAAATSAAHSAQSGTSYRDEEIYSDTRSTSAGMVGMDTLRNRRVVGPLLAQNLWWLEFAKSHPILTIKIQTELIRDIAYGHTGFEQANKQWKKLWGEYLERTNGCDLEVWLWDLFY